MQRKNLIATALLTGTLAMSMGCATAGAGSSNQAEMAAKEMLAEAEHYNEMVKKKNFEWKDTTSYIEQARAALKEGDYATALQLADHAELQGRMAYEQALQQADAGPY